MHWITQRSTIINILNHRAIVTNIKLAKNRAKKRAAANSPNTIKDVYVFTWLCQFTNCLYSYSPWNLFYYEAVILLEF